MVSIRVLVASVMVIAAGVKLTGDRLVAQDGGPARLTARWVDGPPAAESAKLRRELTAKQRNELGLTLAAVRDAVRELRKSGEIDDRTSTSEVAAAVLGKLEAKDPKAFAAPGLDLDAILEWLEKVIPIIMKIIALFSSTPS